MKFRIARKPILFSILGLIFVGAITLLAIQYGGTTKESNSNDNTVLSDQSKSREELEGQDTVRSKSDDTSLSTSKTIPKPSSTSSSTQTPQPKTTPVSLNESTNNTSSKFECGSSLRNSQKAFVVTGYQTNLSRQQGEYAAYQQNLIAGRSGYTQSGLDALPASHKAWLDNYVDIKISQANTELQATWTCDLITRQELGI